MKSTSLLEVKKSFSAECYRRFGKGYSLQRWCSPFMPSLHLHPMMSFHSTSRKADLWDALAADSFLLLPPTSFLREWDIIEGYRQGPFWHLLGMILLLWSKHNYSLSPGHKISNRRISARSTPLEKGIEPPFWRWWAERERLIKMLLADASMQ